MTAVEDPYYIGTRPYKFDEWVEGEYCRLVKVDDYWGNDLPADDNLAPGVVRPSSSVRTSRHPPVLWHCRPARLMFV